MMPDDEFVEMVLYTTGRIKDCSSLAKKLLDRLLPAFSMRSLSACRSRTDRSGHLQFAESWTRQTVGQSRRLAVADGTQNV